MTPETEVPNVSVLARTLLSTLRQRFPAFGQCMPLAIGIDKLLLAEMPEISRKTLRVALNMHTNSSRYLKATATATVRFDLAGNPAGDVSQEHRTRAAEMLKERFKKEREQRNAARIAEEAQRKADEAQRKIEAEAEARAEKLNQLAAKFSVKAGR
ncbi:MAG: ProQ/FinO family protein [Pseudomonadota bacterium]